MKKIRELRGAMLTAVLAVFLMAHGANESRAQIADGSLLTNNIIITDVDGQTWNVFNMLDSGKTVVLDLFAEWCGPCWNYHHAGHLAGLYNQYGPDGTDELMVIAVETDPGTPHTAVDGGAGSSYGWDWTAGVPYPVASMNIGNTFEQGYYPYIVRICPNRQIYELGQLNTAGLYNGVGQCLVAEGDFNPHILEYRGETMSCGGIDLDIRIQNLGTQTMEAATFDVKVNGETVMSTEWTGELDTYEWDDISLGEFVISQNTVVEIATNDADEFPGSIFKMLMYNGTPSTNTINVRVRPDANPHETTWDITDAEGNVVASGGPYETEHIGVMQTQTVVTELGCHVFNLYDSAGDGFGSGGLFLLADSDGNVLGGGGGAGWEKTSVSFKPVTMVVGVSDISHAGEMKFFPNPGNGMVTLDLNLTQSYSVTLAIHDVSGRVVHKEDLGSVPDGGFRKSIDLNKLGPGVYFAEITGKDGTLRIGSKIVITR